ncbi:MAG TPA: hypothetical protein VKG84_10385 [Candidatus Acidoferrales bacterium]|nr:hypothetical protein [Candidatus Acidoferrales bacterium]
MLRLTQTEELGSTVFVIEGKLAGPSLAPLAELLRSRQAEVGGNRPVIVDLMGVTSIDCSGKGLLKDLHANGATFRAKGCLNRAIVEGITCCEPEPAGAGVVPARQGRGDGRGKEK